MPNQIDIWRNNNNCEKTESMLRIGVVIAKTSAYQLQYY